MGKRDIYEYYLVWNNKIVDTGTLKQLADKYEVNQNNIYMCFKKECKFNREYTVRRRKIK